jgi:uncharacterized protein (DUF58 family)
VTAPVRQRAAAELLDPAFLVRLAKLELNVRRMLSGDRRGDLPINRRGPGMHFRGHRAYAIGDDPRFLDCSASMSVLDGSKLLAALRVAAALGTIALARHGSVRIVPAPAAREPSTFGGKNAMTGLLSELARLEGHGAARLLRAFQASYPPGRRAGLVLVLSDFLSEDDFRAALKFLRARGNQVEALHAFTPAELTPGVDGMVELVDVETGRRIRERVRADQVERYRAIVEAHFKDVAASCRGLGCGYHELDASQPMEKLVLGFLESRALVT